MNGYCIKNKTKFKVEIKINGEKMFIEPEEEKRILGNITLETEFPDKLEIKHISECKEKSKPKVVKPKESKSKDVKSKESKSEKEEK